MATKLSVNLNKVATIRNTRTIGIPDIVHFARIALDAGAQGITVHPRPDERHIRRGDVDALARVTSEYPGAELNVEGNPFDGLLEHAERVIPTQCTLVPDERAQATSDHGWDLDRDAERLRPALARLRSLGCRTSLFMDAEPNAMARARELGADRVELYTEPYAAAFREGRGGGSVPVFQEAATAALKAGLGVNAGHDLNLQNLGPFLAAVTGVMEVSIGHALVADALELGFAEAVRRYLAVVGR